MNVHCHLLLLLLGVCRCDREQGFASHIQVKRDPYCTSLSNNCLLAPTSVSGCSEVPFQLGITFQCTFKAGSKILLLYQTSAYIISIL